MQSTEPQPPVEITNHIKAAIIGFYRSGATVPEIHELTGVYANEILSTINVYLLKNK